MRVSWRVFRQCTFGIISLTVVFLLADSAPVKGQPASLHQPGSLIYGTGTSPFPSVRGMDPGTGAPPFFDDRTNRAALYTENVALIGSWLHGPCYGVAQRGDTVYINDGSSFQVVDFTTPWEPAAVGRVDLPDNFRSIVLSGNHAYIADSQALRVVDITDPANPILEDNVVPAWAADIDVAGDYVYICEYYGCRFRSP